MNEFQKEVFVHNFIINNIEYNNSNEIYDNYNIQTAYNTLIDKVSSSEGIAKTVKLLLDILEVKCIVVSGKYQNANHSWNIVKLDDCEYNLDVTMDLQLSKRKDRLRYDYFNFRDEDIEGYEAKNKDKIPTCTAIFNNYVIRSEGFVSNYARLLKYIEKGLEKKKKSLYFKINRNVNDQYKRITIDEFKNEIEKACEELTKRDNLHFMWQIDNNSVNGILSMDIDY